MERLKVNEVDFAEANVISDEDDVVRLMTMHKSKGLEYKVVFVSGYIKTNEPGCQEACLCTS